MEEIEKPSGKEEKIETKQVDTRIWMDHSKLGVICLEGKEDRDRRLKIDEEINKDWDKLMKEKDVELAKKIGDGANEEEVKQERLRFQMKVEKLKKLKLQDSMAEERTKQFKDYELVDEFEEIKKLDFVVYKKNGKNVVGRVIEKNDLKTLKLLVDNECRLVRATHCSKIFLLECVIYLKDRVLEKTLEIDLNAKMWTIMSHEVNTALQDLFSISSFCFVDGMKIENVSKIDETQDKDKLISQFKRSNINISLIDPKIYYKVDKEKETISIDMDANLGQVPLLHNSPLEILLITPESLRGVQLYNTVRYNPATTLKCFVYPCSSIYVHGIGIYGPYPNTKGPQSFKFLLEIENMKTSEKTTNALYIENEEPAIWKLFFNNPILVKEDECFSVKVRKNLSRGLVYALKSDSEIFYGDDGVRFSVANFEDHFLASVYYTRS